MSLQRKQPAERNQLALRREREVGVRANERVHVQSTAPDPGFIIHVSNRTIMHMSARQRRAKQLHQQPVETSNRQTKYITLLHTCTYTHTQTFTRIHPHRSTFG